MKGKITKITDLVPDKSNFNLHTEFGMALLEKSMRKNGFVEAGVISEDGVIISGNARQEVANNIGIEDVQIIDTDGKKAIYLRAKGIKSGTKEFHELALQLNQTAVKNILIDEALAEEILTEEVCKEWGLEGVQPEITEDDFDAPPPINPISKAGDIYELNLHRVLCGDSTLKEDVEKLLDGNCMGALVTDPPYNVGVKYTKDTDDNKSKEDFILWCKKWIEFCPNKKILTVGCQRLVWWDSILGDPQWIIVWIKKNGQGNTNLLGTNKWDAILLYNVPQDRGIDIIEINNDYSEKIKSQNKHPTAKPIALFSELIKRFTFKDEIIYDPFLGSGTTLIAAEQLSRTCYGIEISPAYIDLIVGRWIKFMTDNSKQYSVKKNGQKLSTEEIDLYLQQIQIRNP